MLLQEKNFTSVRGSTYKTIFTKWPHSLNNGILLRSDFIFYMIGLLTITTDNRIVVSKRIKEDYGNGRNITSIMKGTTSFTRKTYRKAGKEYGMA